VALKMIRGGSHADDSELARFRTEAETIARLQHPHIVQIFDIGTHDGLPFVALEFVEGGSLTKRLAGCAQPPAEAARLVEKLARAMHAAHQRGVIHRDLKPANVLLTADGEPKITDFGLAKQLDSESGHTIPGQVMGTPSYMAPEQAAGRVAEVGPRADVYALAAILYEMLTARPPCRADNVVATLELVREGRITPPRELNRQIPRDLETICLKGLATEPARRYDSAAALADDLWRFLRGEAIRARRIGALGRGWRWCKRNRVVAGLLTVLVLGLIGLGTGLRSSWPGTRSTRRSPSSPIPR
jgi:eukaryotic-like serine/threonine-protein kinase